MATDVPLINGIRYDFATIECKIDGAMYLSIKSIDYDDKCEPGVLKGTHPQPIGRTTGEYTCTCSVELYKHAANAARSALGDGYMTKIFNIAVNYAPAGSAIITDDIIACRITSCADSHASGTDGVTEKWTLQPMKIVRNGLNPFTNMLY